MLKQVLNAGPDKVGKSFYAKALKQKDTGGASLEKAARCISYLVSPENKLITSVTYNIKTSYNYRSWSKKTILPSQIGQWRVDIIDNRDRVLGSRKFQISTLNNAF